MHGHQLVSTNKHYKASFFKSIVKPEPRFNLDHPLKKYIEIHTYNTYIHTFLYCIKPAIQPGLIAGFQTQTANVQNKLHIVYFSL